MMVRYFFRVRPYSHRHCVKKKSAPSFISVGLEFQFISVVLKNNAGLFGKKVEPGSVQCIATPFGKTLSTIYRETEGKRIVAMVAF